jgi:hypothetical protein
MARESREVWVERVRQWRESGQAASAFAEANGLNVWTLRGWSGRLQREQRKPRAASRAAAMGVGQAAKPLPFVELITSATSDSGDDRFEVVLSANRSIRVHARFDADALRRLLEVIDPR